MGKLLTPLLGGFTLEEAELQLPKVLANQVNVSKTAVSGMLEEAAAEAEANFAARLAQEGGVPAQVLEGLSPRAGEYVNLASPERTTHILDGDATGGGHLWPGKPDKTPFPQSWSRDRIMHEVSDIATDPVQIWVQQTGRPGSLYTRAGEPARFCWHRRTWWCNNQGRDRACRRGNHYRTPGAIGRAK